MTFIQLKMTLAYILVVSMLRSISMSYENGLQLWKDCPSMQSTTGSMGSRFEITIQTSNYACKNLLSELDTEKPSRFSGGRNDLDMQLTNNKDCVNITWNVQYESRYQRRIFMLDVEYRINNSRGMGTRIHYSCFRYNFSKGEPRRKETVTFYFDCMRTVPYREAYLIDMTLWSLPPNWSASSRTRRSAKSDFSGIRCTSLLKKSLRTGPIQSITKRNDNVERRDLCQCWDNSNISLERITDTKDTRLVVVVANPNPYAAVTMIKVYKQENATFPIFSVSLDLSSPEEKVKQIVTNISCENGEGTYTPELEYKCDGRGHSVNTACHPQYIDGPSIICQAREIAPPPKDLTHFIIIMSVLAGVIATVSVVVLVLKVRKTKPVFQYVDNRHCIRTPTEETEMTTLERHDSQTREDSEEEAQMQLLVSLNFSSGSRQIMLLDHTDSTTATLRKDCVNLITELLKEVNIEVLGSDGVHFFRNCVELVETAAKDDITEFLIIMSKDLVSFHNSYMTSSYNREVVHTELQSNTEYFSCAVLKTLRDRYFLPGRAPFRIHILSLEHADSQICEKYIDKYSSFMISRRKHRNNTFLYSFAKYSEEIKSFVFDETVLPCLLQRLNGTTTLPEDTRQHCDTTQPGTFASKLKEQISKLFENPSPSLVRERTDTA